MKRLVLGYALLSLAFGCASPYRRVMQVEPNPFVDVRRFAVLPLEYGDITLDSVPEQEYLEASGAKDVDNWKTIKQVVEKTYYDALVSGLEGAEIEVDPDAAFVLRSRASEIESGRYEGPANRAMARLNIRFQIARKDGEVLDEIILREGVPHEFIAYGTTHRRLRAVAEISGHNAASYVEDRVK